jgi:hypothetical protein
MPPSHSTSFERASMTGCEKSAGSTGVAKAASAPQSMACTTSLPSIASARFGVSCPARPMA